MTDAERPVRIGPRSVRRVTLTRTQSEIRTSQRLHPQSPLANMAYRIRLRGPIDPDRLVRAFDTTVRACEVLRLVVDDGPEPTGRILVEPPRRTEAIDLPAAEVDAWVSDRIERPIDATSCVYDSVLLRHDASDWTWWLDLHHVATDAWSSALVFRATSLAYELDDGDPTRLADIVDGTFFDDRTHTHVADAAATWAAELDELGVQTPIAPYGPRGGRTTAVERLPVPVDPDSLATALQGDYRTLSRDLSLLTVSAMATALLIRRLDGRRTVVLGVPVHHRSSSAARRQVGPLMEIAPLVVTVDDTETNAELFGRVYRSIVALLRRAKPGQSPEVDVEVVLNVFSAGYGDFAGIPTDVDWVRSGHVEPNHVVRSQVSDHGGASPVRWELDVNTELSADHAWRRLPDHLAAVIAHLVDHPDRASGDVTIAAPAERDPLTAPDIEHASVTITVHESIRNRLASDGSWIVAEQDGVDVDAATFDRRADATARWLAARGVGRGSTVGLRMRRGIDVLIAIHGVLRSGAAFVMLDPADPVTRHDLIADDAALALILDELPHAPAELHDGAFGGVEWERPVVDLDDLAYVLYTSGSTGVPKGVPISHRGLADYLQFAVGAYVDHDEPVVALHSSLVFDLTITSLFLSFLTGGCTVVFTDDPVIALGRIADDDRITVLKATPSQLELFSRMADRPRPLRSIVVGGEAFRRPVAERIVDACAAGVRIFNEYGPTEAVVGCMIHEYDPALDVGSDVPIGRAAPGCEVRVLDDLGRPSPTGAWGELVVRRAGMAVGYLNRPELSAERFVDLDGDGRVWYRTGDRVRVERPHVATYGGRMDDQVKVNGIRLEPAEVEAALVTHPDVDTALVRVWSPAMRSSGDIFRCARCGLGADVPGVTFSVDGVCSVCHSYDAIEPQTRAWFKTEEDLDRRLAEVRARHDGDIDCVHLLSGGKDSTYALYQLVERGWRVHALTLDNGFISDGAKENIRRSVADLGITHEFATSTAMNEIFRDSLDRHSNVCQGCYKTIYTMGVARARDLGVPVLVTGLSRGQFFETRLVPHQFEDGRFDPDEIDRTVLEARRVYHHTPDAVTELLPEQSVFDDDRIFDEVEFLDFYRYVDVDLADVYRFLEERAPWVRPADTGRSTNCLINVAGIQVHRRERGYHNYAEPYSWDVRLGHKTRDEALEELDDEVDDAEVARLLDEVGYRPKANEVLTAWYQAREGAEPDPDELRAHLRRSLPEHAVPSAFVRIDDMPMAASAKADVASLPAPTRFHRQGGHQVDPATPIEARLARIWADVLSLESVGVTDDFFDLGGASLAALEVVAAIDEEFATDLHDAAVFRHRTIRELAGAVAAAIGSDAIGVPILRLDDAPLSAGEEAMLFEYRAEPSSTRYNVTRLYTITGDLDLSRLESAIRDVAAVHGPLHTSYGPDRRPLDSDRSVMFDRTRFTDRSAFERFADVQRTVPFDLDHGPLLRVHTARTGPDETSLLIGLHHISIDAGTFDVLWAQVAQRYAGGDLANPEHTYAEHGAWQRATHAREATAFWLERSAARRPTRALGLAAPSPRVADGYVSRRVDLRSGDLATAGGTPFATSMAAAAAVLATFVADDHVEFGITASTKDHPAAFAVVGYYLNTLPVTFAVERGRSFADLVRAATTTVSDALPYRTYPFASIVRDARAAGHELPDVSFMLAYEELATPELAGAQVAQRILASGTSVADISLIVQERADSVEIGLEYRGTILDETTATQVLDLFESVLVGGVRNPAATIGALLAADLTPDLSGSDLPEPEQTVPARLLANAAAHPASIAVVCGDSELSYGRLAARALALAGRITAHGPVRRVGVCVHRSTDLIVAIIAAQLSGAAYVPLDPTVGEVRLARIVEDAELDRLVVDRGAPTFEIPADRTIRVDEDEPLDGSDTAPPAVDLRLDGAAYVMFTSGSTGRPKGVEVTHANLAASTAARSIWYSRDPDRFLLTSSIGFDSSVVGLFWTLATGGTIVVPTDDEVHDVDRLGQLIHDRAVTHTLMVPSLYRALLTRRADRLGSLSVAIVAGEPCPDAVVVAHETALPTTALFNEYGPTEATVWATVHRLATADGRVPIGTPIPGVTVRIADTRLAPVPTGVAGELLITGPTVARYIADPRAAPATDTPFTVHDGRRWYRTGDLARSRDGLVDFVGRLDDQLNVGGVRLEPAEVETELRRHSGIGAAIVVAAGDPPKLVAHVETDEAIDEPALRSTLAASLPPGAVPSRIVGWRQLPRTVHGKLDRAAAARLPVDDGADDEPNTTQAPTSTLDLVLATWSRALGRRDLEPDTDFFDVGGDSLAAVEIVTRLGEAVGREIGVGALLAASTPRRLAASLAPAVDAGTPDREFRVVTLRSGPATGPLVVMTPAWDDVFGYQALARSFGSETTVVALLYDEQPDRPVVTTVAALVSGSLPIVRSLLGADRSTAVLGWSVGGVVAVELAERLRGAGERVDLVAAVDTFFPGEHRHLWSNRWWKYRSMLRPGAFGAAAREFGVMGSRRVKAIAGRLGRRLVAWSGAALPDEPVRTSVGGFPVDALDHPIDTVTTPMVFYAAATTNPRRTVEHWVRCARDVTVVRIPGRHRGFDSVMAADRVSRISDDLSARLGAAGGTP